MKNIDMRLGLAVVASPLEVGADQAPSILKELQKTLSKPQSGGLNLCSYQTPVGSARDAVRAGRQIYDERVHAICVAAASWLTARVR